MSARFQWGDGQLPEGAGGWFIAGTFAIFTLIAVAAGIALGHTYG